MKKLETIVTELGVIGKNKEISSKYDPRVLTSANEYIEKLEKVNTETEKGLESYKELTGINTKDVAPDKTASNLEMAQAGVTGIFGEYITKHIEPITEELETKELKDMLQLNIGYRFCPETESKSEKYNAVRNTAYTAKDTIEKIKENPGEYINKQIKDAPDFMKAIIAKFSDEILQIDTQDAQRKAFRAIHEYGSAKFVTEIHEHLGTLRTAYNKDMTALNDKKMKMKKENPYLDTDESVKYFAGIEKEKAEIEKRKEQFKDLDELIGTIAQNAIKIIQEKEKAEAEKRKVIQFPTPTSDDANQERYRKAA